MSSFSRTGEYVVSGFSRTGEYVVSGFSRTGALAARVPPLRGRRVPRLLDGVPEC